MFISSARSYAFGICAAVVLAGCGSPSIPSGSAAPIAHLDRAGSWMAPGASGIDLLYVSDLKTNDVYVFSYPDGTLVGTLTGFVRPWGLCADREGNVFITDDAGFEIFKYAHGGTSPVRILKDPGEDPGGCSVDPVTGNLAVANVSKPGSQPGNLAIYKKARGKRKTFKDPGMSYYQYCGYDGQGNLFVTGMKSGAFVIAELPRGGHTFTNIVLNENIKYPGGVQWDGTYVAVRDYEANVIYQFSISGSSGTEVGATPLDGSSFAVQFWIAGSTVVAPNANGGSVGFWNYPAGGTPTQTIGGLGQPWGATVSLAQHR